MQKIDWKQVDEKRVRGVEALRTALLRTEMYLLDAETISIMASAISLLSEVYEAQSRDEIRRTEWFAANAVILAQAQALGCIMTVNREGEMIMHDINGMVVESK
jgi:hypothetical protein